jgi:type III pantothenate kinase
MKWGRVDAGRVSAMAALDYAQPNRWAELFDQWNQPKSWHLSGVVPDRQSQLDNWLAQRSITSGIVTRTDVFRSLDANGLSSRVERPDLIGIDRLLGVLGGWRMRDKQRPVVTVAVGTATTVDVVDAHGVHRGGVIFPGPALMAKSLHDHTAALPLVPVPSASETLGRVTETAIAAGIHHAVVGAVERIVGTLGRPCVFITGGDAGLFESVLRDGWQIVPTLILDGLAHTTEAK